MEKISCKKCGKNFSTKGALVKHRNTAKYCTESYKDFESSSEEIILLGVNEKQCEYCKRNFSTKYTKASHEKICDLRPDENSEYKKLESRYIDLKKSHSNLEVKYDNLASNHEDLIKKYATLQAEVEVLVLKKNLELEKKISFFQGKLEAIQETNLSIIHGKKFPPEKKKNNKFPENPLAHPLTKEFVEKTLSESFKPYVIKNGQIAVLEYICSKIITVYDKDGIIHRNYFYTDKSRSRAYYLSEKMEWEEDVNYQKINMILSLIYPYIEKIWNKAKDDARERSQAYYKDIIMMSLEMAPISDGLHSADLLNKVHKILKNTQ